MSDRFTEQELLPLTPEQQAPKAETQQGFTPLYLWQPEYWLSALREAKSIRNLCLAAMFAALVVVIELIYIPLGTSTLRIMFSYLPMALTGSLLGPFLTVGVGIVSDVLGALLFPSGAFFPGYTLTAIVSALIYSLFLYKKPITLLRLALCKLLVNLLANVVLNSVWNSVLMGKAYLYYLSKSIVKNLILWPIEVILLALLFSVLRIVLRKYGVFVKKGRLILALW